MRIKLHTFVAALTAITLAGPAVAAQTTPEKAVGVTVNAEKANTTLMTAGKIVRFDPISHQLVVSTRTGDQEFTLGSMARIREGGKMIADDQLPGLVNHLVKLRYTETSGMRTVQSVNVNPAKPASQKG